MRKIILASSSKHRKKLLNQLKIKFTTKSPDIDESKKKMKMLMNLLEDCHMKKL